MMLQTYYRQCGYKPYHALKGMLPLVLEVPFLLLLTLICQVWVI